MFLHVLIVKKSNSGFLHQVFIDRAVKVAVGCWLHWFTSIIIVKIGRFVVGWVFYLKDLKNYFFAGL